MIMLRAKACGLLGTRHTLVKRLKGWEWLTNMGDSDASDQSVLLVTSLVTLAKVVWFLSYQMGVTS